MTGSKLIDSSVWISYLSNGFFDEIIEKEEVLFLSSLSIFEIKKVLMKRKIGSEKISEAMEFVKKRCLIIPLTSEIAEKAAEVSSDKNLPLADSIIYCTAILNDAKLYTLDNDFRGLDSAVVL
jgi:toxin FitB